MFETNDTLPNSPEQPDQPVPPDPTFPAKFIQRALIGHGSNLRMQVDGREIETTLRNASIELQLSAGKHVVHVSATADFLKSKELPIEVFPHGDNTWVVDHTWPYNRYRVVPHERRLEVRAQPAEKSLSAAEFTLGDDVIPSEKGKQYPK